MGASAAQFTLSKGTFGPLGSFVDGAGNEFLAGASLSPR